MSMLYKLKKILNSVIRERRNVESSEIGGVMIPIIKLSGYSVYIYGCGVDVDALINYLMYNEITPNAVFDRDSSKTGQTLLSDVNVYHISKMGDIIRHPQKSFVFINIRHLSNEDLMTVTKELYKVGVDNFYFIPKHERDNINAFVDGWDNGRMSYYRNNSVGLEKTYSMLEDDESRATFVEYIRVFMQNGVYNRSQCDGRVKYFYGETKKEKIYEFSKEEVWLNAGSNIGDTILLFFQLGLKAKCIYAYEGDSDNYKKLIYNLKTLDRLSGKSMSSNVVPINKFIKTGEDLTDIKEKLTLINADIEGAELYLLNSLSSVIIRDRPVIAICVYHKKEDLIAIPEWFAANLDSYVYKLRKYEAGVSNPTRSAELVMYAIPNERNI